MNKVYQENVNPDNGDCFQAVIASLFETNLIEVPKFVELKEWYNVLEEYINRFNYTWDCFDTLYNQGDRNK